MHSRKIPSYSDTNAAGQRAYIIATDILSQRPDSKSHQKAATAIIARLNYNKLEKSLYSIGKTHIFAQRQAL